MKPSVLIVIGVMWLLSACRGGSSDTLRNSMDASAIVKLLDKGKPVQITDRIITGDLDFSSLKGVCRVGSNQSMVKIDVPVTFVRCIFLGKVRATHPDGDRMVNTVFGANLTFEACDFRAEADFSNCTVNGMANFSGAKFRETAMFNNAWFGGPTSYFGLIKAEKNFLMQQTTFVGNADFLNASFQGKASWQSTDFRGTAQFSNTQFEGKADFSMSGFRNDVWFNYASFDADARFLNCKFATRCDMVSIKTKENFLLNESSFAGQARFDRSEMEKLFDLSQVAFYAAKPDFSSVKILPGNLIATGATYLDKPLITKQ